MDSVNKWLTLAANLGVFAGIVFSLVLLSSYQLNAQPGLQVGPGDGGKSMSAIVSLPRKEAISMALQPEYEDIRPGILNIVFRMWAMEDPIGAFEAYELSVITIIDGRFFTVFDGSTNTLRHRVPLIHRRPGVTHCHRGVEPVLS